ncbi:hypothetical protein BKA56DRAFT_710856 [Ilyonectria sp. MPI-CAGE-AT-0026]|nr:hypothetical protein BKA56DRAFT_710856 [Ilyonectria sp. MPI-CAGE-AT-0026]
MVTGKVLVGALLAASTALGAPTTGRTTGEMSQISTNKDLPQVISDFDHFQIHARNEGELQKPRPKAESEGNAKTGDDNAKDRTNDKMDDKRNRNPKDRTTDKVDGPTKDRTNDEMDDKTDDKLNTNPKDRTTGKADDKTEDKQNNNPSLISLDTLRDLVKDLAAAKMDDKTNNPTNGTANDVQNINLNNATLATLNDVVKQMSQGTVNVTMDDKTNNTIEDPANDGQNSDADYAMVGALTDLLKEMSKTNDTADSTAKDKKGSKEDYDKEQLDKKLKQMSTDMIRDMVKKKLEEAQGRINGLPKDHPDNRPTNYNPKKHLGTGATRNLTELLFNRPLTYSEYTARNWMWLRCRTFTSNQFDVGGNWPGHFGSWFLGKLHETKCAPINWQFEYVNGQRWGDAYVAFDWWSTGCDQIRAVKAAIKAAAKSATEMRRELYIYNCVGFNDYPWSFVEMRKGEPLMMQRNKGLGMDPAATAQQKWENGEKVPGFDPIVANADDDQAKEEEEEAAK